jgi:integrase
MLTGARRGEVAGMSWAEIDLTANIWTLPKERSKNHRAHALPLAPLARATLNALPRFARQAGETDLCFSARDKIPNDFAKMKLRLDDAVLSLRREIDPDATPLAPWVVHDIRRSLISGMARLGVELHVIERVVNHVSGSFGGIVSVYQKHKYEDQMRLALERWAAHIERVVSGEAEPGNVVEMARR